MNPSIDKVLSETELGEEEKGALKELLHSLANLPNREIKSVILYGSAASDAFRPERSDVNVLIFVDSIDVETLRTLVEPVAKGRRGNIAPFFLTEDDVTATVDIFPLKYLAMKNRHRLLYGTDFLADLEVSTDHALIRIRQRLMNMLLRMRRLYLVNNGHQLTAAMSGQGKRFIETLGILLALKGRVYDNEEAVIEASSQAFGLSGETLRELCRLRDGEEALSREYEEELYGRFLDEIRTTSRKVTALHAEVE